MSIIPDLVSLMNHTTSKPARFAVLRTLPPGYRLAQTLEIASRRTLIALNVAGFVLALAALLGFSLFASGLPPGLPDPLSGISPVITIIVLFVLMLALHEALHGLTFRLFGARPRYGLNLRKSVAFASAADDYVARDAYIVVALVPLVVITLLALVLMLAAGGTTRDVIGFVAALNVGGSVGDLWFVTVCRRYPRNLLVRDFGEGAALYAPPPDLGFRA
jgi:hypothetical protein